MPLAYTQPDKRKKHQWIQKESGISLLETLFAMSIILVISASFYALITFFYQNYAVQEAIAETQQQSRVTIDLFWQEIRNTGFDPTGTLFAEGHTNTTKKHRKVFRGTRCARGPHEAEKILEATPTTFQFLVDINQNGKINQKDDSEEQIRYEWVGDQAADGKTGRDPDLCGTSRASYTLYRDSGNGMREAATGITAFRLLYFDEMGNQLPVRTLTRSEREQIRRVLIQLTAQVGPPSRGQQKERTIETDIWLRNL